MSIAGVKKFLLSCCVFWMCSTVTNGQQLSSSSGSHQLVEFRGPVSVPNTSPNVGNGYTMFPILALETSNSGNGGFLRVGLQVDPEIGSVRDSIMDGTPDVIGYDFADFFGHREPNPIVSFECLEVLGKDPVSERFVLKLTVGNSATGTTAQWDTLIQDLQDPRDVDQDNITGKGPDGIYGTGDDVVEADGLFDTGDGVLDAMFPLDPVGLFLEFDDGISDPFKTAPAAALGMVIGTSGGGRPISFDSAAGPPHVATACYEVLDAYGNKADVDGDGIGDGPYDVSDFTFFSSPNFDGWSGSFGVTFLLDSNPCSINDRVNGNVRTQQLVVTYYSDIRPQEFCFKPNGCDFSIGDVNNDGSLDLLDVSPLVDAIIENQFVCEADINRDGVVDLLDVSPFIELLL